MAQSTPFTFTPPSFPSFASPIATPSFLPSSPAFVSASDRKRRISASEDDYRHTAKRPNLANGFSGLSISPRTGSPARGNAPKHPVAEAGSSTGPGTLAGQIHGSIDAGLVDDDDDVFGSNEVKVEELPERQHRHENKHTHSAHTTSTWDHWTRGTAASSPPSSSDTSDSETHFTLPRRQTLHADEVEDPDSLGSTPAFRTEDDLEVEDVEAFSGLGAEWSRNPTLRRGLKRRTSSVSDGEGRYKKSRGTVDDMDMDTEMNMGGDMVEEDVPEIDRNAGGTENQSRGRVRGRSTARVHSRTKWHEPEKDRIIYTHLSSSPSSSRSNSRSRSRSSSDPHSRPGSPKTSQSEALSQPGKRGFTISPSMLTRLLAAQHDGIPLPFTPASPVGHAPDSERGLVLYRPLGIPPGVDWREVVEQWTAGNVATAHPSAAGRFEVVDEDENMDMGRLGGKGGEHGQYGSMDMDMGDDGLGMSTPSSVGPRGGEGGGLDGSGLITLFDDQHIAPSDCYYAR